MERALRMLDVIYANAVAREIENLRREMCCGCKTYQQDCLMMTEQEGWDMHGMAAMERVNSRPTVWHKFLEVLAILNTKVHKEFADHFTGLQKDPDPHFVRDLLQLYTKTTRSYPRQSIAPSRTTSGAVQYYLFQ